MDERIVFFISTVMDKGNGFSTLPGMHGMAHMEQYEFVNQLEY
jgi:hypothetical protein